jgi:hypothetical protein
MDMADAFTTSSFHFMEMSGLSFLEGEVMDKTLIDRTLRLLREYEGGCVYSITSHECLSVIASLEVEREKIEEKKP